MRYLVLVLMSLLFAACQAAPTQQNTESMISGYDAYVANMIEADHISPEMAERRRKMLSAIDLGTCEKDAGEIVPQGMMGGPLCLVTYADAGKACTDSSACMGQCRHTSEEGFRPDIKTTGICTQTNSWHGCYSVVKDGYAQPALCVD